MSVGKDNFFTRWSRRKQAVRDVEAPAPDEKLPAASEVAAEEDAERGDQQLPEAEPAVGEPPEPLPSLEDLTAESDLSAFFRDGVPKALKNAALRKMWSLDPAVRDYVGPAEYAWDFNQPGSMGGFGPLEASRSVGDFLSKMSTALPVDPEEAVSASRILSTPPASQTAAAPPEEVATTSTENPVGTASPAQPVRPPRLPATPSSHSANRVGVADAESAEKTGSAESSQTSAAPRHGSALPR